MSSTATIALCSTTAHQLTIYVSLNSSVHLDGLRVDIAEYTNRDYRFFASLSLTKLENIWQGSISLDPSDRTRILEVTSIQSDQDHLDLTPSPKVFLEPAELGLWVTGDAADSELRVRVEERETYYNAPLIAEGSTRDSPLFKGIFIYDGILISQTHRVPGISISPLLNSTIGSDVLEVINQLLPQFGFTDFLNHEPWLERTRRERPTAVLVIDVHAENADAAVAHIGPHMNRLALLVAYRRNSSPIRRGGVLAEKVGDGKYQGVQWWTEQGGYRGNLVTGFLAGEDQESLLQMWERLQVSSQTEFLLSLYRNALAETFLVYQYFRLFSILESVGLDRFGESTPVLDQNGQPRYQDPQRQKPYTSAQARGKVYLLASSIARSQGIPEDNLVSMGNGPHISLWEMTEIWTGVRNQVAHSGRWYLAPGETETRKRARLRAKLETLGSAGNEDEGIDRSFRDLRNTVNALIALDLR